MDSNTLKFGQLASLTAFTGQTQATEAFATAAIQNEVQVASLKNLSLGVEAAYEPHKLGQGTQDPYVGMKDQYRRYQEEVYTNKHYGVESIDKQNLLDYKKKVDRYVEMGYLPANVKAEEIKGDPRTGMKSHSYTEQEKDAAKGFAGMGY